MTRAQLTKREVERRIVKDMTRHYWTDVPIKYNLKHNVELLYNVIEGCWTVRSGGAYWYFDRRYQALEAYYELIEGRA